MKGQTTFGHWQNCIDTSGLKTVGKDSDSVMALTDAGMVCSTCSRSRA